MFNRRVTVAMLSSAVLLAACGGGGGKATGDNAPVAYGSGDSGAIVTTTAPVGATTTGRGSATTVKPAANKSATTNAATGTTATGGRTAAVTTAPVKNEADAGKVGVGLFSRRLLRPAPAKRIVLELLVQEKVAPADRTIRHVTKALGDASGKPVTTPRVLLPAGGDGRYSAAEVIRLADEYGQAPQGGDQAVIRMLVLAGQSDDPNVLGFAVRGDVLAIFPDRLKAVTSPVVDYATLEDAVTMHEVGHILGLVDLARKTGREDKNHPGHSPNPKSVMYWAIESSVVGQVLGGPPPVDYDSADLADLAALRDGA